MHVCVKGNATNLNVIRSVFKKNLEFKDKLLAKFIHVLTKANILALQIIIALNDWLEKSLE